MEPPPAVSHDELLREDEGEEPLSREEDHEPSIQCGTGTA